MKATPFKIIEFKNRAGSTSWRVTGMLDGKQIRRNFSNRAEADGELQALVTAWLNLPVTPLRATRLTDAQIQQAEVAFSEIDGFALSLVESVKWAKQNYSDPQKRISVAEAFEIFLSEKRAANLSPAYLRTLNQRVGRLAKIFDTKLVSDVQKEQVQEILYRRGSGIVNQESDHRAFSNFFTWAVENSYCVKSPMHFQRPKIDKKRPVILSLAESRRLIAAAMEYKGGVLVPYVTLTMFCGLRPDSEIGRISWDDIDLVDGIISVPPYQKTGEPRQVEIPENAAAFLAAHAPQRTPIKGKGWRRRYNAVKLLAKCDTEERPFVQDILRHTAISNYYQLTKSFDKTEYWSGTKASTLKKHYQRLVKQSDCDAFWQIMPNTISAKILKMA